MIRKIGFLLSLSIAFTCPVIAKSMQVCRDADGNITYSDVGCPTHSEKVASQEQPKASSVIGGTAIRPTEIKALAEFEKEAAVRAERKRQEAIRRKERREYEEEIRALEEELARQEFLNDRRSNSYSWYPYRSTRYWRKHPRYKHGVHTGYPGRHKHRPGYSTYPGYHHRPYNSGASLYIWYRK